jgi:hypothetical protein
MSITRLRIAPGNFFVKWGSGRSIMRLVRGLWERYSGGAGRALWLGSLVSLALALSIHGARAEKEGLELGRRSDALGREIDRVRRDNQALRDELRALETDPVYLESLLRRWKMAGRGERVVE